MRGAALNAAASDMVTASRGTSNQLAVSTKKFSLSYQDLLDSGMKLAGQAKVQAVNTINAPISKPPLSYSLCCHHGFCTMAANQMFSHSS